MEINTLAAALAIGLSAIGTGLAEMAIGSSAVAAITEKEELFGRALILTVIPETILILGFVIALMILGG